DDYVGYNHAILCAQAPTTPLPEGFKYLNPDLHPELAQALEKTGAKALWVRPDRYIGAMAADAKHAKQVFPGFLWDS
ncbi:MAG: hypothetical protein EBT93_14475, partial [Alphaproteobacteria bacterium]|nr:hypothetical protein [Alphaproteobacteria bacterium]